MYKEFVAFVREQFHQPEGIIPLHAPHFVGKEKEYLVDAIDSTIVSSIGGYVDRFEEMLAGFTGARYAVATINGTSALHIALLAAGIGLEDEVLTQALSYVATANAIAYTGAQPVFLDVDRDTLALSPEAVRRFLESNTVMKADGNCYNKNTGRRIKACVPMNTFGFPARLDELKALCDARNIVMIEDAAESLGSYYKNKHTGTFGLLGVFSFNGNKIITCGGGGAIVTNDVGLAEKMKHLTTMAKVPHQWAYDHDQIGYNYRLPNLNAALACAQMEQLPVFLENKKALAHKYQAFFEKKEGVSFIAEPAQAKANNWLNAILFEKKEARDVFLQSTNEQGVMSRPVWTLLNTLPMYRHCESDGLEVSKWLEARLVNIPSSVRGAFEHDRT